MMMSFPWLTTSMAHDGSRQQLFLYLKSSSEDVSRLTNTIKRVDKALERKKNDEDYLEDVFWE